VFVHSLTRDPELLDHPPSDVGGRLLHLFDDEPSNRLAARPDSGHSEGTPQGRTFTIDASPMGTSTKALVNQHGLIINH
jgi:hypothetical protein